MSVSSPSSFPLVADKIAAALARHGVEAMFSQSLPSRVVLACEDIGIRQVTYRTENAGGTMADGLARISNKLGVVCAQNGPAAALLVPPLAEALKASIPVLAIVQEVNREETDRNAFQELDHISLFSSCTKWARKVTSASRVEDYVDMAVTAAMSGRPGPVALMFPADLLNEPAVEPSHPRSSSLGKWPLDRVAADPAQIEKAADLLAAANRPVIVAGGGVHASQACDTLARFQDEYAIPVGTTMMGKGCVDETHALSLGLIGNAMGNRSLGRYFKPFLAEADLIVLIGNRTNQNGTDSWRLLPSDAKIIHIDIDGQEVGRTYEALRLVGDARLTLEALGEAMSRRDPGKRADARTGFEQQILEAREAHSRACAEVAGSTRTPLRPERIMRALAGGITEETIVVADASYSSVWINTQLTATAAGARFLTPRGLAGLGWGVPLAIGAQVAQPNRQVVCVCGDGGFGHVWSELETLVREKLPVKVIVLNNTVLGYQKDAEDVKFGRHSGACQLGVVDHAKIAEACGCPAIRIDAENDLDQAMKRALSLDTPCLIEVMTDPDAFPPLSMFDGIPGRN